jgi:hypothetical protein
VQTASAPCGPATRSSLRRTTSINSALAALAYSSSAASPTIEMRVRAGMTPFIAWTGLLEGDYERCVIIDKYVVRGFLLTPENGMVTLRCFTGTSR